MQGTRIVLAFLALWLLAPSSVSAQATQTKDVIGSKVS